MVPKNMKNDMAQMALLALWKKKNGSISIVSFVSMLVESANCAKSAMQIFIEIDRTDRQKFVWQS